MKIQQLTDTLSVQLGLLQELLSLVERETRELTGINLEAMTEINGLQEDVAARIEAHGTPLRLAVGEAAVSVGLVPGAPLGELSAILGKRGNKEVPRLHQELNRAAKRVRQAAAMNREIAERFATAVNQSLNSLMGLCSQSPVYGASGSYQQRQVGAVMINMEA